MSDAGASAVLRNRAELVRWSASLLVVLTLYGLGAIGLQSRHVTVVLPDEPPAALMVDPAPEPKPVQRTPEPAVVPPPPQPTPRTPSPIHKPVPSKSVPPVPDPPPNAVAIPEPPPEPSVAAAPAPAPAATAPAEPSPQAKASFASALLARLERYKRYPVVARQRHQQGVVSLRFAMDRSGRVLAAQIAESSGHDALDQEVLSMIKRAEPLPPLPPDMPQAQLELVVPIRFVLR
jgi:periplasmic protein TonB